MRMFLPLLLVIAVALAGPPSVQARRTTVVDEFESLEGWTTNASSHARVEISLDAGRQGQALRVDYEIEPGGSFILVRKALPIELPRRWGIRFWLRGEGPTNDFQVKLVDRRDANVWWYPQKNFPFPSDWRHVLVKDPRVFHAWGPLGGGPPKDIAYLEFAVAAGAGGRGTFWIDRLEIESRETTTDDLPPPRAEASSSRPGREPGHALDPDPASSWHSGSLVPRQWLQIDFQSRREYGGFILEWDPADYAVAFQVRVSDDGELWDTLYATERGSGGRTYVYAPDADSRFVRIEMERSSRGQGYALRSFLVQPYEMVASPNEFFETIAGDDVAGSYPRYLYGEQAAWTSVGPPTGRFQALLSEDGSLEPFPGSFTIEPFLFAGGQRLGWNSARSTPDLEEGELPIPSVTRTHDDVALRVTVLADDKTAGGAFLVRYRLRNLLDRPQAVTLFLAVRPFQVLPPWQNLNLVGGVSPIRELQYLQRILTVNSRPSLVTSTEPDRFGALAFEEGSITTPLREGRVAGAHQVSDPYGYASGAFEYVRHLPPRGTAEVFVALPFEPGSATDLLSPPRDAAAEFEAVHERLAARWRTLLGRVRFRVPPEDEAIVRAVRTSLAHVLQNRRGPALNPGARTYARTWIRDGASMMAALLQMGFTAEPREFLRWYAEFLQQDGSFPCCVDDRGPDPVPEHDSNGCFNFAVAEYFRFTRDIGLISDLWPAVARATEWIEAARNQRRTEAYATGEKRAFWGLLPESISHEGYSARPVHSYWDDFWALRGVRDAIDLARTLGEEERAKEFRELHDSFRTDLLASVRFVIDQRGLAYVPASADLGDFDANSTAIAASPIGELLSLPQPQLQNTFDRLWRHFQERERGIGRGEAYTPYELRNVPAFVQLGQRERAWELLRSILRDQRPAGWQQWPEVIWIDPRRPRFVGDLPHAWIGSIYIEVVRSLFVFERPADRALVLAAGLPAAWMEADGGVGVRRLPTHYGVLNYDVGQSGPDTIEFRLSGSLDLPPGGLVLMPPLPRPVRGVTVNGRPAEDFAEDRVTVREFPAEVVIAY